MENQKNNKVAIILLIVLVVILSALCILFATGKISLNTSSTNNSQTTENDSNSDIVDNNQTRNYEEGYDDYLKFKVDNENKANYCQNMNGNNYYDYEKSYVVFVNNITIKNNNYTFRYASNIDNKTVKVYLNDNTVFEGNRSEALLIDVCNYGNYVVYSTGWEGSPYYRIINTDGKIVMSFSGRKVTYSDGMLNVEELNKNDVDNFDDNELIKYQLNMNSDNLQKLNLTTEKYECNLNGSGYDC